MKILLLNEELKNQLETELQNFEASFYYPLGDGKFRISHGDNYTAFFESMGKTICLIAIENGKIQGTISCAIRNFISAITKKEQTIAYIGDLKVLKTQGVKSTYFRLAKNMSEIIQEHTNLAVSVVMHGNTKTPDNYTGRLCIPKFKPLYDIQMLRINTQTNNKIFQSEQLTQNSNLTEFLKLHQSLSKSDYFLPGNLHKRSVIQPRFLVTKNNNACGILEDTRKGKILFDENDEEILSAHLSYFEYGDFDSGINLLRDSISISLKNDYPALFVYMPNKNPSDVQLFIETLDCELYGATVYGSGATNNIFLNINTSEI